jgi:hypothetical protein
VQQPGSSAAQDDYLTFLTRAQAEEIRRLTRLAFAARGREVEVFVDHVRDDQGGIFGLWNVAAACYQEADGARAWPRVISEHVRRVTEAVDAGDPFRGISAAEVLSRTYSRVVASDALPDWTRHTYATDLVPGLKEVLSLDLPETVATFRDEHVERYGGAADLRRAGRANLRAWTLRTAGISRRRTGRTSTSSSASPCTPPAAPS